MKKVILFALLSIMTISASAQIKSVDIKGDLRDDFGLGAGVTLGLVKQLDFSPSFNYYFVDAGHFFTVDADFHYNIPLVSDLTLYPIVGVSLMNAGGDGDSTTKLGFDLGAGLKYSITDKVGIFVEGKYQWYDHWDDSYFSLGVNIGI